MSPPLVPEGTRHCEHLENRIKTINCENEKQNSGDCESNTAAISKKHAREKPNVRDRRKAIEDCLEKSHAKDQDQATKGVWWMPWHQEPTKDAISCDKLRGAASRH